MGRKFPFSTKASEQVWGGEQHRLRGEVVLVAAFCSNVCGDGGS